MPKFQSECSQTSIQMIVGKVASSESEVKLLFYLKRDFWAPANDWRFLKGSSGVSVPYTAHL